MVRLRNAATGVTVDVSKETADLLGSEYESADSSSKAPAKKAASSSSKSDSSKSDSK